MGRNLGELGTKHDRSGDTFGWFGNQVRLSPQFSNLRLIDFIERAGAIDSADEVAAMQALRDFLHTIVHEGDWEVFWQACLDNGQGIEDLMVLVQAITTETTGRPSKRRSDSSPGRRKTPKRSKGGSRSPVSKRLERSGRPDLAIIVDMAERSRRTG